MLILKVITLIFFAGFPGENLSEAKFGSELSRLVDQLGAPSLQVRELAEQRILDLGPEILPHLPLPESASSPEVQIRLKRIRAQLEGRLAAGTVGPSTVFLPEGISLAEALQRLVEQTQNLVLLKGPVEEERARQVRLERPIEGVPFWQSLEILASQGGWVIASAEGRKAILLSQGENLPDGQKPKVSFSGPFRCEILRSLLVGGTNEGTLPSEIVLELCLLWEPRLDAIVFYWVGEKFSAEDDQGIMLSPAPGERTREVPAPRNGCSFRIVQRLSLSAGRLPQFLRHVRGEGVAIVPALPTTFSFRLDAGFPQIRRAAEVSVVLERLRQTAGHTEIQLRARYERAYTAFESHRGWFFTYLPILRVPEGSQIAPLRVEPVFQGVNEVVAVYSFSAIVSESEGEIFWVLPAAIVRSSFEFSWKNIAVDHPTP